jgi:hypothetical protein
MIYFVILIVLAALILLIVKNISKDEDKIQLQKEKYEALLKQYGVPENHTRIVIAQSKVYNLYNCPAVAWIENEIVKTLIFRLNPIVVDNELEDFMFLSSQPLVDFKRYDGSEYPDWARQSAYVKQLFYPLVEDTNSKGGIDYKKQMYWIGTMCVYAPTLHAFFEMIGRPLKDYDIKVERIDRMKTDGSIPVDLLEAHHEYKKEKKEAKEEKQVVDMNTAMQNLEQALKMVSEAKQQVKEESSMNDKMNLLIQKMIAEGATEELLRSTTDKKYQKELFEKYNIE